VKDAIEGVAVSVVLHTFEPAVVKMRTHVDVAVTCCRDTKHAL
jgi:hypothetical protein